MIANLADRFEIKKYINGTNWNKDILFRYKRPLAVLKENLGEKVVNN